MSIKIDWTQLFTSSQILSARENTQEAIIKNYSDIFQMNIDIMGHKMLMRITI